MTSGLIAKKLEIARKELLDLGFRNKLINHKLLKSKGIQADDELSDQLYHILVEKGNKMYFDPTWMGGLLNSLQDKIRLISAHGNMLRGSWQNLLPFSF